MGSIFPSPRHEPSLLVRLFDRLGLWMERSRQRSDLARLDDRLRGDIGVDHATAAAEADKPFWAD